MKLLHSSLKPTLKRSVTPHSHEIYEWHFVVAGNAFIYINGKDYPICAGDFFLTQAGEKHGIAIHSDKEWLVQIIFKTSQNKESDNRLIKQWIKKYPKNPSISIGIDWHSTFIKLNQNFYSKNNNLKLSAELQFESILYQILEGGNKNISKPLHPQIEKVLRFMESNITETIELDKISQTIGLHKSYLIRLFKSQLGQTPMQYFMCLKMEWAATRLEQTHLTISEIGYKCGFSDPFHFSRRFKQWSGQSPKIYRAHKFKISK